MKRCPQCQGACWDAHKHCPACGADVSRVEVADGDPLIGVTVGGKFVLREVLGEGAMGKVYRADQTNLGRTVAVKVMNPILANDEGLVRRFIDEARSASRLNHPNIVSVIDFGQTEAGVLYIVMEYLRGRTLARLIAEEAPLPAPRIVAIMSQILDALTEAHANDVVHRDLKPDNVMVEALRTGGEFAKVLDFGIAKLRREDRDFETVDGQCGTPEYMAPEQVRGQDDVDGRADLYSLGIVLYEMLTGLTPFAGGSHAEVFAKQLNYAPKPPRQARPDVNVSAGMEQVVLKALEKERQDRYPTSATMKAALEVVLEREFGRITPVRGLPAITPAREKARTMPPEPEGTFPLPILSRPEWTRLEQLVARSEAARAAVLMGPDGAGKSSLCAHAQKVAQSQGRACYRVTPDPSGAARAWAPIRLLARELLGLRGKPSLEMIDTALKRAQLDPANLTGVAELFGVVGDFSALEPAARRRECMASALAVLHTAAARKPALLVFEDVDRFDAPSAELVARLLEYPGDGPLVVLATRARGSFQAALEQVELLELAGFDAQEVQELGEHALDEAPEALIESVMAATDGLPLHVEQILRFIAEGGGEPYPSLADTIGARIARLPQEARTLLQAVAIAGGEAPLSLLRTIELDAEPEPESLLAQRGFAVQDADVVRILHPLFTDVAYEGIPEEVRRDLHRKLWRAFEGQHAEPQVSARHAYFAGERRAVALLERAGERAQHEFDYAGAARHYRRAVELQRWALLGGVIDAEVAFVRLSVKLGESLHHAGDMMGAEGVLREALGYAQGHPAAEARVRLQLARLGIAWDQLERAERELRAGLRVAFKAGDAALLGELYLEFGGLCIRRGDLEAAIDELSEGIALTTGGEGAEAEVGPAVLWRLVARQAETLQQVGDTPAALAVGKHALRHARRVRSLVGEARVHTLLGLLYDAGREPKLAADHRAEALALARRLGDRRSTAELLLADAQTALQRTGMRRDTLARLKEASQLAAQVGWKEGVERTEQAIRQSSQPPKTRSIAPQNGT